MAERMGRADSSESLTHEERLDYIVRTIVERFDPYRIILFGSRARGEHDLESDYDIMVEMDTDLPPLDRSGAIYSLFRPGHWPMDVIAYTPAEVRRQREVFASFVAEIEETGRVLYDSGRVPIIRNGDAMEKAEPDHAGWVRKAEQDLRAVEVMLTAENVPWGVVCFHAQQAGEKYLKAFLVHERIKFPRTHDLEELLELIGDRAAELTGAKAHCKLLTRYAVAARYPFLMPEVGEAEGREAADAARRIAEAVRPLLERESSSSVGPKPRPAPPKPPPLDEGPPG